MISPDYVLCYIPLSLKILWEWLKILEFFRKEAAASLILAVAPLWFWKFLGKNEHFGFFCKFKKMIFWKITSCNFQSRWPIMMLGGEYSAKRAGEGWEVSISEKSARLLRQMHIAYFMFGKCLETLLRHMHMWWG